MEQLLSKRMDRVEEMLMRMAQVLAANTQYTTMVTGPHYKQNKLKFIQLSAMGGGKLLAVIVLNGNIDPVDDVYSASPEHTKAAIIKAADSIGRARAMFMPGCELPTLTNLENVKAISDALVEIGG